jgi:hypothetical protein
VPIDRRGRQNRYRGFRFSEVSEAEQMALHARLRQLDLQLGLLANFHGARLDICPIRVGNKGKPL